MKLFKHIQRYSRTVLFQTRPSLFYGVDQTFRLNVMQPFKTFQVFGLAVLPNIPCHGPAHFAALNNHFVLMLCKLSTTFKSTARRAPPNTVQLNSRCRKHFLVWMVWSFSKTLEFVARRCSRKHGPVFFMVLINFFVEMLFSHLKTFKFMAGPRSPTSPVTVQLISRRWKVVSFYGDCQQRSTQRLVVLPLTRYNSFHDVETFFLLVGFKFLKNIWFYGWAVLLQLRPSSFHGVKKLFSCGCYAAI